ncbi:MAG: translation initiation factor IF-2, partial [Clostridia bacterium]|nr:translation initiation factor IF-2 [Clostridia bacterium]
EPSADQKQAEIDEKIRQAVFAPVFAKPKKQVIEKPVIRIYVPPVEENRGRRGGRDGAGRPPYPRSGSNQAGPRPQGGRPPMGPRPILPPPVMPNTSTTNNQWSKKKGQNKFATFDEKKAVSKKKLSKKGGTQSFAQFDEFGLETTRIRTRKVSNKNKQQEYVPPQAQTVIDHAVLTSDHITIKELSEKIGKTGVEIIKKLFLLGIIKTINDNIDFDTADLVASELGVTLELNKAETSEEKLIALHDQEVEDDASQLVPRPPIVTIMGHVDHGKTSILDYIRKANVVSGEAGGITQHIGAYSISINGSPITFLDTPGHEAFTAMRARGANVTDIVIIVVAADDGIMPQTVEAINHAKAANVSIIIAVNKIDKAGADPDRVLTQLTEYGLVPEDWGGNIPVVKVSAKTGEGISSLLDTILISSELMELMANPDRAAKGTIVEAKLDKGKGPMATVLVQNGTLNIADFVVTGSVVGKIRAMQDDKGRPVSKATPSMAVSILGLQEVPDAGDQLMVVSDEKLMKQVADERISKQKAQREGSARISLEDVSKIIAEGKLKALNLIIKADVQGSVEALKESLNKLSNEEVKVSVVHAVAGAINESDVMLADTTGAIIIGFNVRPDSNAKALAEKNNIDIKLYRIIYDAIDDIESAIKGMLAPKFREQYLGKAEVRAVFKISGVGTIGGCMVKDGKIVRNANVRVIRDNIIISETSISSLKRLKDDVKEVATGFECGIGLENFNDLNEGDLIESFHIIKE